MSFLKNALTGHWENTFGSGVGHFFNDLLGSSDMLKQEYKNNVALWNMQNEYNTPAAQIARMKAAGIDINPMTYALGEGGMSSTAGSISAPSAGASGVNPITTLMSVLSGIETIKGQHLQNELTKEDLQFYKKNHFRPGTGDWATKIIGLVEKFFGDDENPPFNGVGLGTGSNEEHPILDMIDDVVSGSYNDNKQFYRSLKSDKAKKLFKRRLKELRGYKEYEFEGW